MAFWPFTRFQYTPLSQARPKGSGSHASSSFWISLCLVVAAVSFLLGRQWQMPGKFEGANEPQLHKSARVFEYKRLFGERPSPASNHAWLRLFPEYGGFFMHPQLAPQRSAFSVFHQLHCLDGIRKGYWALYDIASSGSQFNESELPTMGSPPHFRHCVDLLRQALMCQPDLTVEVKDEAIGGVKGFGTEHVCYDWDQLVDWTREWQDGGRPEDDDGKGGGEAHGHGHGHGD